MSNYSSLFLISLYLLGYFLSVFSSLTKLTKVRILFSIGKLKVFYRTHSEELIYNIHSYLSELIHLEKKYNLNKIVYDISEGKFIRNFTIPEGKQYSQEEIARGISDYVKNFDYMMKKYLCGKYSENSSLEYDYKIYISKSILI